MFDQKSFAEAQKIIDDLGKQMDRLGDKRKAFISDAVAKLPETTSHEQVELAKQMAAALYDQTQAQEKLDKLKEEGKQITEGVRTAEEAYADQIARLTEMLNAGAISQDVFNKSKDKAYDEQLTGRTDAQAGAIRAFRAYQKEGENAAGAVEKAFSSALSACGTANSNPACVFPPIKEYSKELQIKLADEIRAAPPDAAFPDVLQDYALMRSQIMAGCRQMSSSTH